MEKFGIFEFVIGIFVGILVLLIVAKIATLETKKDNDPAQWEVTSNITTYSGFTSRIITDPNTKQKWLVVTTGNGLAITPYNDKIKAEQ